MVRQFALLASLLTVSLSASANPHLVDCDMEDAARNAAMKATVGVKGPCDAERLADDAKDDAQDRMDDARDDAEDRRDDARDKHDDRRDERKDKRDKH